jgi:hypothetical protein
MGYSGFMNLDEAINLYKISNSVREKITKILTIYNDCFQGKVTNLFFNAGTKEVLENQRRAFF